MSYCFEHNRSNCDVCADDDGYERGRAEERAAIVRYLRVWADSVRDNEAVDGRLQALVTDTHKANIINGEHITRPRPGEGRLRAMSDRAARAHPASRRGGWGVRMYGGAFQNPSGSSLNSYSLGDVVCWDSRKDAEDAARDYMTTGLYDRCEVERVRKGQRQASIDDELEARRVADAYERGRAEERAAIVADGLHEVAQHPGADAVVKEATAKMHLARHAELHKALDELLACYLLAHKGKLLKDITAMELIEWSHKAAQKHICGR